jgi:polysaccharide export outer membrane protein
MREMTAHNSSTLAGCVAALMLMLAAGPSLQAQFSGPALNATPDTNAPQRPTTDPAILMPQEHDNLIGPGDLLTVKIFGTADYAPVVRVSVEGFAQLPLIGPIKLAGLTINRAEDVIAQQLINAGMYVNPQVNVQITEAVGGTATVAGEMHAIVPINGDRRLFDVLAAAGSMPVTASHTITILRAGVEKPIVVDIGTDPGRSASADIPILPGDKILVSRVGVVYVLGAFKNQGAIPLQQNAPLTLLQASALSGGEGYEGKFNDLRIIRTVGLTRTFVRVDLKRIMQGKDPDPVLQADDIVFLPADNLKAAIKSGGINVVTSIASLLIVAIAETKNP